MSGSYETLDLSYCDRNFTSIGVECLGMTTTIADLLNNGWTFQARGTGYPSPTHSPIYSQDQDLDWTTKYRYPQTRIRFVHKERGVGISSIVLNCAFNQKANIDAIISCIREMNILNFPYFSPIKIINRLEKFTRTEIVEIPVSKIYTTNDLPELYEKIIELQSPQAIKARAANRRRKAIANGSNSARFGI